MEACDAASLIFAVNGLTSVVVSGRHERTSCWNSCHSAVVAEPDGNLRGTNTKGFKHFTLSAVNVPFYISFHWVFSVLLACLCHRLKSSVHLVSLDFFSFHPFWWPLTSPLCSK